MGAEQFLDIIRSDKYKVVCFEVFNVALLRATFLSDDIYDLLGREMGIKDFKTAVRLAFMCLKNEMPDIGRRITSIDLFEKVSKLFPQYNVDAVSLSEKEERLYSRICSERKFIKKAYEIAVETGKEICFTAETTLSVGFITKLLNKNGYHRIKKIYVSSENGLAKSDGSMFEAICDDFKEYNRSEILNLGSNYELDLNIAKNFGLKAEYIAAPISILKKSRLLGQLYNNYSVDNNNGCLIAHSANLMFDNPFENYSGNSYFNGSLKNFSFYLFGPFLLTYTKWMLDDCQKKGVDSIVYVYRDGYLINQIHQMLSAVYKNIRIKKAYITRAIVNTFNALKENGLNYSICEMLTSSGMTRDGFIRNRLLVNGDGEDYQKAVSIFKSHGVTDRDSKIERADYFNYAWEFENIFKKNAQIKLEDIRGYINSVFQGCKKPAVFDVGYRGSACRFLNDYFNLETVGYHFFAKDLLKNANGRGLNISAPIYMGLSDEEKTTIIQVLTEDLLNSQEDSVTGIIRNGESYEFIRDKKNYYSSEIDEIQKYCLEYAESFIKIFKEDFKILDFDIILYYEFYRRFLEKAKIEDAKLFSNMKFVDSSFMNPIAKNAYLNMYERIVGNEKKSVATVPTNNNNKKNFNTKTYSKFRLSVYRWLKAHHMLKPVRAVWRLGRKIKNIIIKPFKDNPPTKDALRVIETFNNSVQNIQKDMFYRNVPTIAFVGHNVAFDKGTCSFINRIAENDLKNNYLYISESPYLSEKIVDGKINFSHKTIEKVPMANSYDPNIDMPMNEELKKFVNSAEYIKDTIKSVKKRFPDMGKNYAEYLIHYLYRYYTRLIELYNNHSAQLVFVVWNEFTSMHNLLHHICLEKGIPVLFFEFGVLPGTICMEEIGQMGESLVARENEKFNALPVSEKEISDAVKLCNYLKKSGLNRNPQPINNNINEIKKKLKKERPVLLYFGQNDFESGMYPYTQNTALYHSPVYKDSNEAAKHIEKICIEKDYNFIYKPHPTIMQMYGCSDIFEETTIIADNVDINELIDISDVTLTILSQAAYISLIRGKPVIMLGYNQLKGKGCSYECYNKKNLSDTIARAITDGFTKEQVGAFINHIAKLNKYYLIDDYTNKGMQWGQPIEHGIMLINRKVDEAKSLYQSPKEKQEMKIAIVASMPANYYSGGRSHAWNLAESLAYKGNKVYFISNNEPIFKDAMKGNCCKNEIIFVKTSDFNVDLDETELDYLIIAPHRDRNETFYLKARNLAIRKNAKLVLINYESGNWVNKYLDNELPDELWNPWKNICNDGCLVLSSDRESMKYAQEYYVQNPAYTKFDFWYPTVNTIAADNTPSVKKCNQIIAFIRLNDKYKGSYDILDMIDERLKDYKLVLIYGAGKFDDNYNRYVERLNQLRDMYGVDYEIKVQLTDEEKFTEIKKSKYLLFPSYFEGYGTPPIEAQYCDTICFAYDLPVLRETAGNGIVFCEYGNPKDMQRKLIYHIENGITYQGIKKSVYDYANFEICAEKLDKLFRKYLSEDWRNPKAKTNKI